MKKKIITLTLSLLFCQAILAKPYQAFNYETLFISHENGDKAIDFSILEKAVVELRQHAGEYPIKFDNETDKELAKKDVLLLSKTINYLLTEVIKGRDKRLEQNLMLLEARVAVMAYNFDYAKALHLADKRYETLVKKTNDSALKLEYGVFLANSNRTKKAEKLLKSALDEGEKSALYSLAVLSVTHKNQEQALKYLKKYIEYSPADNRAKDLLQALENDKVSIKFEPVSE